MARRTGDVAVGGMKLDLVGFDAGLQLDVSVGGGESNDSSVDGPTGRDVTVGGLKVDLLGVEGLRFARRERVRLNSTVDATFRHEIKSEGTHGDGNGRVSSLVEERIECPTPSQVSNGEIHSVRATFEGSDAESVRRLPVVVVSRRKVDADLEGDVVNVSSISRRLRRSLIEKDEESEKRKGVSFNFRRVCSPSF